MFLPAHTVHLILLITHLNGYQATIERNRLNGGKEIAHPHHGHGKKGFEMQGFKIDSQALSHDGHMNAGVVNAPRVDDEDFMDAVRQKNAINGSKKKAQTTRNVDMEQYWERTIEQRKECVVDDSGLEVKLVPIDSDPKHMKIYSCELTTKTNIK